MFSRPPSCYCLFVSVSSASLRPTAHFPNCLVDGSINTSKHQMMTFDNEAETDWIQASCYVIERPFTKDSDRRLTEIPNDDPNHEISLTSLFEVQPKHRVLRSYSSRSSYSSSGSSGLVSSGLAENLKRASMIVSLCPPPPPTAPTAAALCTKGA